MQTAELRQAKRLAQADADAGRFGTSNIAVLATSAGSSPRTGDSHGSAMFDSFEVS